jgi:uncharacterized protein (TIGR03083 family)
MTANPGIPTETVDTLVGTWHMITGLLTGLDEEQWKRASDLPGWTVQDIVSHLIGTERMLQGLPPAPARTTEQPWVKNAVGDFNENDVELRRRRPGAEVLAEWNDLVALRERTLTAGDADYFAQPMVNPTGPGTLADFLAVRILDCWIHEQDLRRALGVPGGLSGPAAEHTIDRLLRTVPIVVGKRAACPEGRAVRLVITGGVERDVVCEVNAGRAGFVGEAAAEPLTTVTIGIETFVRLANGRPASPDDDVTIAGDTSLGQAFVAGLNMMI